MRKVILLIACLAVIAAGLFLTPNQLLSVNAKRSPGVSKSPFGATPPQQISFSQDNGASTDGLWQARKEITSLAQDGARPVSSRTVSLNADVLEPILRRAPLEFTQAAKESLVVITLPLPDGTMARFRIEESPIMQADLAARLPKVKTYRGQGIDDPTATTRFDWTPLGFHGIVLSSKDSIFITPAQSGDMTEYVTQADQGRVREDVLFACGVSEKEEKDAEARGVHTHRKEGGIAPEVSNAATLRTYRLAVATTGEWYGLYGGGSVANAQTAITSIINLVDAIYEREVAIRFTVVNNTNIIFTNSATDPYSTNAADSTTLAENQTTLDNVAFLGSANYDVGHVFGGITGLGVGSSSFSGVASLGVVCTAGLKGRGVSTMGNNPALITAGIFVGGVAHELAHQFNAPHTFNTNQAPCGAQRTAGSAYEVGAGSTLMSYSICGADNLQGGTGVYLNVKSLEDIVTYATTFGTCSTNSATGNTAPTVAGPGNFTIPISTPFTLNATASDTNGPLTYSWEQYNLGAATTGTYVDTGTGPLFRGYNPTPSPSRTFPSLTYILNNANVAPGTYLINGTTFLTGEVLPTTDRTMVFQVVVRDNQTNGGGINTATSTLTVENGAGPFQVTAPNGAEAWIGGAAQNVTWNVNSTNLAPVSTANVRITLSTNGGINFPITLLASTPNDGTESVTVPNGVSTTTARVRVEAVGNIFFDISNANFSVQPGGVCPAVADISPKVGNVGTVVTITGNNFTGVTGVLFSPAVPASSFTVNSNTNITATTPIGAVGGPITLVEAGCANTLTPGYNVCASASTTLSIGDNVINTTGSAGGANYFVNRLTPASYPSTLRDVQVLFHSVGGFTTATPVTIVVGTTTNGSPDSVFFTRTLATTVSAVDVFSTYALTSPLTITSGDFVMGYIVDPPAAVAFPRMLDTNSILNRSFRSDNQGNSYVTEASGNYLIRGTVFSGACTGPTAEPATISGRIQTTAGAAIAGVTLRLTGEKSAIAITDSKGDYRFDGVDTDSFYRVTPALANYQFSPSNLSFTLLGNKPDAIFTALPDAVVSTNALDTAEYFVRQQYLDFLGREPDQGGFEYWSNEINRCGADANCVRNRRIDVAAAFFVERELQDTGSFIYRLYKASFGQAPRFAQFMPDRIQVVGGPNLEASRIGFVDEFVARDAFRQAYPNSMTADQFVSKLFENAGLIPHTAEWESYVQRLNNGGTRAEILRDVIETNEFKQREYNPSFVLMEYFGYLRRDPEPAGYDFWLDVLNNREPGNFRGMVCSFITSTEYQKRFSSVISRSNGECGQ